jgi:hypothetical protein
MPGALGRESRQQLRAHRSEHCVWPNIVSGIADISNVEQVLGWRPSKAQRASSTPCQAASLEETFGLQLARCYAPQRPRLGTTVPISPMATFPT